MEKAIWQGMLTGLVLATFIGPIFFAIVDLGLKGHIKGAAYLAFGTFVSDLLTVLLIYSIARSVDPASTLLQVMYVIGGSILVILGLQNLLASKKVSEPIAIDQKSLNRLFAKGFLINSTNPNVFFFWFGAVMSAVNSYRNEARLVLVHFITALIIVFSTDFLKGYSASLVRAYIKDHTLGYLSRLSGIIIIYFGLKLIFFH